MILNYKWFKWNIDHVETIYAWLPNLTYISIYFFFPWSFRPATNWLGSICGKLLFFFKNLNKFTNRIAYTIYHTILDGETVDGGVSYTRDHQPSVGTKKKKNNVKESPGSRAPVRRRPFATGNSAAIKLPDDGRPADRPHGFGIRVSCAAPQPSSKCGRGMRGATKSSVLLAPGHRPTPNPKIPSTWSKTTS